MYSVTWVWFDTTLEVSQLSILSLIEIILSKDTKYIKLNLRKMCIKWCKRHFLFNLINNHRINKLCESLLFLLVLVKLISEGDSSSKGLWTCKQKFSGSLSSSSKPETKRCRRVRTWQVWLQFMTSFSSTHRTCDESHEMEQKQPEHLSLTDLLDGGGELQTQLDDSAFGGGEVVGAAQRSPGKTECWSWLQCGDL